jgi:hypothetical protein
VRPYGSGPILANTTVLLVSRGPRARRYQALKLNNTKAVTAATRRYYQVPGGAQADAGVYRQYGGKS